MECTVRFGFLSVAGHLLSAVKQLNEGRNIPEVEKTEKQLRLQSAALQSSVNAIVITDGKGLVTWVNPAFSDLTGYTNDEVLGQNLRLLKSGKQGREFYENLWKTILSGKNWYGEIVNRKKDGSLYIEEQNITPVRDKDGEITHFIAIKQDITARKQAEEERIKLLAETQVRLERLQALYEIDRAITSTLDLSAILDILFAKIDVFVPGAATDVVLRNNDSGVLEPMACRNFDEEEWKGEVWRGGYRLPGVILETRTPLIVTDVQADSRTKDAPFFRKYGLVSYLGLPLLAKGEIIGVLDVHTQETRQFASEEIEFLSALAAQAAGAIHNSRLYERAEHQAMELEKSYKVKSEFLSVVSHELRNPLTPIMGYTGLMIDRIFGEISQEQEQNLKKVMRCSVELLGLINSILEATAFEAGALRLDIGEVGLSGFLEELRGLYGFLPSKELVLIWDHPPDLPAIMTDRAKLNHILRNLINNAIKFTNKGEVRIVVREIPEAKAVRFIVADSGMGIPKESLPVIFDMFRQVGGPESRVGGVGLGLHIVKKCVELLGGAVAVESEPGKGSTFTVTLPVEPAVRK